MSQTIKMVIQLRRDTAANWELYKDKVPAAGEPCFVTDKNILKIGDGVTTFEKLKPINGVNVAADGETIFLENGVLKLKGFNDAEKGAHLVKGEDGTVQWVTPSTGDVDELKITVGTLTTDVDGLKTDVADLKAIVGDSATGSDTLLSRVEGLEKEVDTILNGLTPDDGKIDSLIELINYVDTHGQEAAKMVSDINTLYDLVGSDPVADQIVAAVEASENKANAAYEHVKYEVTDTPVGTLVDYRDKEIRIMVPAGAQFTKQTVGAGGDANNYYMTFKTYAPSDDVVGYIEHLGDQADPEILTNFSVDKYGRRYQSTWLSLARYDEAADAWTYYGANSTVNKYTGWDYQIDWYNADGVMVASDCVRINLSNEDCHHNVEPSYMGKVVKEVVANGTLLDVVGGRVDISADDVLKSSDEIDVNEDGTLSVKSISFSKIAQTEGEEIILFGGGAAG